MHDCGCQGDCGHTPGMGDLGPLQSGTLQDLASLGLVLLAALSLWRFIKTGK